jgi:hypothetical protein
VTLGETYKRVGEDGWRFVCDHDLAVQSLAKHAWRRGNAWRSFHLEE